MRVDCRPAEPILGPQGVTIAAERVSAGSDVIHGRSPGGETQEKISGPVGMAESAGPRFCVPDDAHRFAATSAATNSIGGASSKLTLDFGMLSNSAALAAIHVQTSNSLR